MKKASWVVALLVGVVAGVALDRMVGGGSPSRPVPHTAPTAQQPRPREDPNAVYRVPVDDTPLRGSPDALVTIVVASDFQCPYCKRVEPALAAVLKAFPGKVREGWKNFPLPFHAKAEPAAIVAEEARAQGGDAKFWVVHDKLFESAPALDRPDLERIAAGAGLDVARVRAALDQAKHRDVIRRDMDLCRSLGVNATPTLFVNGRKVAGALPFEQLKPIVEEELRKAEALVASGTAPRDVYAKLQEKAARSVVYLPGSAQRPTPPRAPPAPPASAARVPLRPDDPARGPASAKVTIALFSDFQCPFCARVEPTLRQLEQAFPGQLRVVWKHRPLPFHKEARPAAEAAEAAREQGKFWEMHDRLFANQSSLSTSLFESSARDLGLNLPRFKKALETHAGARRIDEDSALAASVGASGTPTLFIDCRRVAGAYPFETFKPIVEEELHKAEALAREGKSGSALYGALCDENVKRYGTAAAADSAAQPKVLPGGAAAVPLRPDDPVKGRAGAPVTVVLFSDFQCPFCARAEPVVKQIEDAHPDQVRIAWKHLPLPMHKNAVPAALAAEAARAQGGSAKFWAMHDKLFADQGSLSAEAFERYARELGLDVARFRADLASPALRARIDEDGRLAAKLGISATPTFVVNGERVVGSGGLRAVVERLLAQAKAR